MYIPDAADLLRRITSRQVRGRPGPRPGPLGCSVELMATTAAEMTVPWRLQPSPTDRLAPLLPRMTALQAVMFAQISLTRTSSEFYRPLVRRCRRPPASSVRDVGICSESVQYY